MGEYTKWAKERFPFNPDLAVGYIISWPEERYPREDVRNSCRGPARMAVLRAAAEGRV